MVLDPSAATLPAGRLVAIIRIDHPLRVAEAPDGEPRPYIRVRGGLEARLARAVFYQLVEMAEPDPAAPDALRVRSAGRFFHLGAAGDG